MRGHHPLIGISASFMHADPQRALFKGKTLLFAEESLLHWVMSGGAIPVLIPTVGGALCAKDIVARIDGLMLQGGADMSPRSYGEEPLRPEWVGDHVRDVYEIELVRLCIQHGKPVLGICRGTQLLNVALGGTLYQDIQTLHPEQGLHRNWDIYDQHGHEIAVESGSWLERWYSAKASRPGRGRVNSVHHQGLKQLGRGLIVEARSIPDGIVEAVRYEPAVPGDLRPFVYGVQWHPEFMFKTSRDLSQPPHPDDLDPQVLLQAFLEEVEARRSGKTTSTSLRST